MNFYTFKWGTAYGPEYVNRLYGSLLKHYDKPFTLTCYTDDHIGIYDNVIIKDIQDLRPWDTDMVFTFEKLILIEKEESGIWFDLDILIHKNITKVIEEQAVGDFKMIYNHWNDYYTKSGRWWGKGSSCHINSSMVYFNNPEWLTTFTRDNWDKISFTYKSLDKYMFYQHHRTDRLEFWDNTVAHSFNYGDDAGTLSNHVSLFNTSHIKANKLSDIVYELHEAGNEVTNIWKSYD